MPLFHDETAGTSPVDTELPAAVEAADNMANPTAPQVLANTMIYDGSAWDRARGIALGQNVMASSIPIVPASDYIGSDELNFARGAIASTVVHKFGTAPSGVQTTLTDIWDRADATPTQQLWLAPTAPRIHAIVSDSASDDGSPVGVGARTIRVYGLTSWASAETSEDITLNGVGSVNTVNSYVIIHRMKVLTSGATSINVGTITATAATDATVTAAILPGNGQTEMAIYGVPSTKAAYMYRWGAAIDKAGAGAETVDFQLRVNENPDVQTTNFLRKDDITVQSTGNSSFDRRYGLPQKFTGPCIIKIQGIASAADTDGKAGFDLVLL